MAIITSPITGQTIDALNVGDVMGFAYADLNTFLDGLSGADITLKYPEFERSYGEWGALLREGRIPATSSDAVDPNATAICGPYYFTADSRYYNTWTEKKYVKEIRRSDVTKILRGEAEYSDFLARIIQANLEGFRDETNTAIEQALFQGLSEDPAGENPGRKALLSMYDGSVQAGWSFLASGAQRYEILDMVSFDDYWTDILATTLRMTNANSEFTEGDSRWGASPEDLTIYIPQEIAAASNVKYRQRLENTFGLDRLPQVKTYNQTVAGTAGEKFVTFILDKRVLNHVTRYMEYNDDRVACRESLQVSLHVEDMIKYVPFYKAWAIITNGIPTAN